jgi:6-phosphofructokinase
VPAVTSDQPATSRTVNHMSRLPPTARIGVLTTGGDCPGLNAAIARLCGDAAESGVDLVGIRNGYPGLLAAGDNHPNVTLPLYRHEEASLARRGGTILGSIRANLNEPQQLDKATKGMEKLRLDGLIVIGGNGGMESARRLAERGVPIVGIPKTIDNDVAGTERAIGFSTAVNNGVHHLDVLDDTATSHGGRFLIEVMGRRSGALAAAIAEAGAADGVLIPEAHASCDDLHDRLRKGNRSRIVIAEAAWCVDLGKQPRARSGQVKIGGIVSLLSASLEGRPGMGNLRTITLGHLLRGGTPTAEDRFLAQRSASVSLATLLDGASAMVVSCGGEIGAAPLNEEMCDTKTLQRREVEALGGLLVGQAK